MSRIPFPLRSNPAPFAFMGEPRIVNCYPEDIGQEQRSPVGFLASPGLLSFSEVGGDLCRGLFFVDEHDRLYSLNSGTLSEIESDGTATAITGTIPGSLPAIFARNDAGDIQIVIVSDATSWVYEDGAIHLVDLPDIVANSACGLAQRIIYGTDSGAFYWSELNDARTVNGDSFSTAESLPDGLVRVFASTGELWLMGKESIEIFGVSGDPEEPFARVGGAYINVGLGAKHSVAIFDNAPHWVDHTGVVRRGSGGYQAQRVSTHAVEAAIAKLADKSEIRAYTYSEKGHAFYVLTCTAWTWVFDQATGVWHERMSYQRNDWLAWPYARAFEKHIVGSKAVGELYQLDADTHTEDGQPIRAELTLPDVAEFPGRLIVDQLAMDIATGVGLGVASDALGFDPKVMLTWSDDGGYSWSNERTRSLGREGDFLREVAFNRLGMTGRRGRRFKVAITDPVLKSFLLADIIARPVA